ncbi:protein scabrous [Cimex lectularius]|uniref:Fibrinogen C-terminal domain-containing protein n=1 Tax=Cimex lectularius TaxID=79782 RepID=A0A8I6RQE9_CIMLE|nr:protein scabrous [Cimex lectularius]
MKLILHVLALYVAVSFADDDEVRTLKTQINSLLEGKEQQAQLAEQLKELRQEVAVLRERCRGVRNAGTRTKWLEASLSEARGQVSELGAAIDRAETTINTLRTQVASNTRAISKIGTTAAAREARSYNEVYENDVYRSSSDATEKKTRHQRVLRKRVDSLETMARDLAHSQRTLDGRLNAMSQRIELIEGGGNNGSSIDKVHASVLELLESVEALETKVDNNLPTVQKEISRTEISLSEVIQQTAIVKEEQENQKISLKAISAGLSSMQDKLASMSSAPATTENTTIHLNHAKIGSKSTTEVVSELNTVISDFKRVVDSLPRDCKGVQGRKIVMIKVGEDPRLVTCDDGWIIVQKRKDGSIQFNRDWEEYAKGFGNPQGEFWIGNEGLHHLSKDNNTRLKVDMIDIYGKLWSADYSFFKVGDRDSGFKLNVSGFSGNASDAMDYQNGMQFSARDSDRDISNTHCAANYEGGWWFSHCQHANLNGRYNLGLTWFHAAKNEWIAVAESTMKLRLD